MKVKRGNLKPVFGSTQQERFPHRLNPEYALIDERTRADRIAFAAAFASLLQYYDEFNKPAGDWSTFFEGDLTFLLARIVTTDLHREQFRSWALYNRVREGEERNGDILKTIWQLVRRMDNWYRQSVHIANKYFTSRNNPGENRLQQTLHSIIETDLSPHFGTNFADTLSSLPHKKGEESPPTYWSKRAERLDRIWSGTPPDKGASITDDTPTNQLFTILYVLHSANSRLQKVANQYLEELLENNASHAPHSALYIAFVRLLDLFRDKINTVTGKHLDFYYRDVLRLEKRGVTPDVAHVSFTAAPQVPGFMLLAGTRLAAGKDASGEVREYATDTAVFINHARVASLRALYLARDRFSTSAHCPKRVASILALPRADSEDGLSQPLSDPSAGWPTFGINETVGGNTDILSLHAELGFIVASPALLLQEGERNVTVSITFSGENSLEQALLKYQTLAGDLLDAPPGNDLLLGDAFTVSLSGEKGWMQIANPSFRRHPVVGTAMEIEFTLDPAAPPMVANPALALEPQRAQWPMLKLALNPFARIYPYSFFKDLAIETIEFRVRVSGLQKAQIGNEFGPLNSSQPFPIFGPVPTPGSYLLVGHTELAVKRVDHIALTIAWFNLPIPPASLTSYYAAYNLGITDESFQVRWSVFNAGKWIPPAGGDLFPLFARDYDRSAGLLPVTAMGLEIPDIPLPAAASSAPPPEVLTEAQAPRGSIRLELAEPASGFGYADFPRIMAEAAVANARTSKHGATKALPNPPFAPVAKSLRLDYEAADKLILSHPLPENQSASFYSLFPFGYAGHSGRATNMFANFKEQGHLYLKMADIGPQQTLTLLFQIRDAAFSPIPKLRNHHDEVEPVPIWRYLSNNEWKDFSKLLLISDTTMGLTQSGIVKLTLPEDITTENTVMPAGFCWLEAALDKVADVYWCQIVSIDTQAVTATRVCGPQSDLVPAVLPAGTITGLSVKQPKIKTVSQPFATSGGRGKESLDEFRARVSERLRHKDRAVHRFDYERLVLNEFSEVGQVKCIGPNISRHFPGNVPVSPGMLLLVAAPRLEDCSSPEPRLPQFVLKKIERFVRDHTSPFVDDVHVINPVYETLKIFAEVEFSAGGDTSYYYDDLNKVICDYLQPWMQKPAKPLFIGSGQVQGYQLAKFIQEQNYVKRLQSLVMLHTYQTETGYVSDWRSIEKRVWASAPWAVLTPAARHGIVSVPAEDGIKKGIPNLTIGDDLVMGSKPAKEKKENVPEQRYFLVVPRPVHDTAGH